MTSTSVPRTDHTSSLNCGFKLAKAHCSPRSRGWTCCRTGSSGTPTLLFALLWKNNWGQIITLVVITGLLATALVIVRDVDRPFGGIINVSPTGITEAERQAARDFLANHKTAELPCDDQGNRRNT